MLQWHALGTLAAAALTVALSACGGSEPADEPLPPDQVIGKASPSVVHITAIVGDTKYYGSGVVINARKGLVLTNAHVIVSAGGLQVRVANESSLAARVLAQAPCDDVALLQLVGALPPLKAIPLGSSATLKPGANVIALGYPRNAQNPKTVTLQNSDGTVSNSTLRDTETQSSLPRYAELIQHQAPLNPGSSGGPLVDDRGRLVGLNTLGDPDAENQGYAISIDYIKRLLPRLRAGQSTADLGWDVVPLDDVLHEVPTYFKDAGFSSKAGRAAVEVIREPPRSRGLYVGSTRPGSAVSRAKVYTGDVITAIDGTTVRTISGMCKIMLSKSPGDIVELDGFALDSAPNLDKVFRRFTVNLRVPREQRP